MTTLFAILVIFIFGFLVGNHYGYLRVREDITRIIEKVEGVHKK